MSNRNPSLKRVQMFAVIAILLFALPTPAAEISGVELLNLLSQKDQISHSAGYKTSFVATTQYNQFNDPNQGMVFKDSEATWTPEGSFAMKITNYYEHPPVFAPPGPPGYTPGDYHKSNLLVWRPLESHILSAPDRNDEIERVRGFLVDPNGQILRTDDNTLLHRFPIDKPYSMYEFNHIQLPMGRGFSRHLGTITSVKSLSSGLLKVTSQGSHGPGLKGTWELTIEPNSDWLVRDALFTPDGIDKPTTVVTSSGVVMKDELKLAKYGVLKYPNLLEYSVEVIDISKVVGPNLLYEEVLSVMNSPLPPGASVVDLRGKEHTITNVK